VFGASAGVFRHRRRRFVVRPSCEHTFVRNHDEIAQVLRLSEAGLGASAVARRTGIPRSTVRTWVAGQVPRPRPDDPEIDPGSLPDDYPYLLGMYLGDGHISPGPRDVYRLRLFLDAKYPQIIAEATAAIQACVPHNEVSEIRRRSNYTDSPALTAVTVYSYSKRWPALFPQHGPGKKHERPIRLTDWQQRLVDADPQGLLRGLIHSDGCRAMNTGRNWCHPRYSFSNQSADIRGIFERACEMAGVHFTRAKHVVYVSRKADVATLDTFVGPKR
jgi:hypothetical protein